MFAGFAKVMESALNAMAPAYVLACPRLAMSARATGNAARVTERVT